MLPEQKEWNIQLIRQIFHSFDADDICKIPIPRTEAKDCIARHPENNGIFSVRCAYRLAESIKRKSHLAASSSTNNSVDRSIWDLIWKANGPPKVQIFGWRVATNSLATKKNKHRRTITIDATCDICGNGVEDEYHAVIACTKNKALRQKMRKEWDLPPEEKFWNTGLVTDFVKLGL